MLWACLYVPELAFAAAFDGVDRERACALLDGPAQRPRVVALNAAARAAGVRHGQAVAAAHALCPALCARPRNHPAETRLLEELAAWSYQFSGRVSLAPPQSLLLEIGASLKLFGGWPSLQQRIESGLQALGHTHRLAVAPTAAAAWLLARHRHGWCIDAAAPLQHALGQLPLHGSGLPAGRAAQLAGMGFRRLHELFRLPRPELQRRIGRDGLDWLDRLRGRTPETLPAWQPPEHFEHTLEFDAEVHGGNALLFPLRRLVAALAHMLVARDGGVQRFELQLHHGDGACTRVGVELATPQREAANLFALARTRLERVALPAPVRALTLHARQLPDFRPGLRDLFTPVRGEGLDWPALCERLAARLGERAVQSLACVAEHRPERAWLAAEPVAAGPSEHRPRPLWLLERPCPLRGPVHPLAGPERLESGWWDGGDQRRDYYVVETRAGQRAWAFRPAGDRGDGWMLHGWFA